MDVGNKTLSQLSDEAKEKRYVALDVGAKVSGYTKEYLERLCRLNKVEYRTWSNGQFVIELDSLLRETHTILLSYEDIVFVEKSELLDPTVQIVGEVLASMEQGVEVGVNAEMAAREAEKMFSQKNSDGITQQVPRFEVAANEGQSRARGVAFSFTGRAVESDPLHPPARPVEEKNAPQTVVLAIKDTPASSLPPVPQKKSVHIPLTVNDAVTEAPRKSIHLSVVSGDESGLSGATKEESAHDEWDVAVLGTTEAPITVSPKTTEEPIATPLPELSRAQMSPLPTPALHPIQTSVDATMHHDDAPLFPVLGSISASVPERLSEDIPVRLASFPAIPDLGQDAHVRIFDEPKLSQAGSSIPRTPTTTTAVPTAEAPRMSTGVAMQAGVPAVPFAKVELSSTPERALERVITPLPTSPSSMNIAKEEEHHLILRDKFALTKSPVFNVAFVSVLLVSAIAILGGAQISLFGQPMTYIAGVVGATPEKVITSEKAESSEEESDRTPSNPPEFTVPPFSDPIVISTSTESAAVSVSPVFDSGVARDVEYVIELTENSGTLYTRD